MARYKRSVPLSSLGYRCCSLWQRYLYCIFTNFSHLMTHWVRCGWWRRRPSHLSLVSCLQHPWQTAALVLRRTWLTRRRPALTCRRRLYASVLSSVSLRSDPRNWPKSTATRQRCWLQLISMFLSHLTQSVSGLSSLPCDVTLLAGCYNVTNSTDITCRGIRAQRPPTTLSSFHYMAIQWSSSSVSPPRPSSSSSTTWKERRLNTWRPRLWRSNRGDFTPSTWCGFSVTTSQGQLPTSTNRWVLDNCPCFTAVSLAHVAVVSPMLSCLSVFRARTFTLTTRSGVRDGRKALCSSTGTSRTAT